MICSISDRAADGVSDKDSPSMMTGRPPTSMTEIISVAPPLVAAAPLPPPNVHIDRRSLPTQLALSVSIEFVMTTDLPL